MPNWKFPKYATLIFLGLLIIVISFILFLPDFMKFISYTFYGFVLLLFFILVLPIISRWFVGSGGGEADSNIP